MPFTDVIDTYVNGSAGTLTDAGGDSVGYTVTSTASTVNWSPTGGPILDNGARVNADGTDTFTVTFDDPVIGAAMQISGSDASEFYFIEVDGVAVNLNTLIASGAVTFTQSGASTHQIAPDGSANAGSIFGGSYRDGSIAELVFNIPVTSLGAYGTGGSSGNWDYIEVGIDSSTFDVVCFARGTQIETPNGPVPIESLQAGDFTQTLDGPAQEIRWIGSRKFGAAHLAHRTALRPVKISAGTMGHGLPNRDLLVSQQHRMLVSSKVAERMLGVRDVLIAALKLTEMPGIYTDTSVTEVEYFHLLFDKHEVIFANGLPSESLFTGPEALKALSPEGRAEIRQIFPELFANQRLTEPAFMVPKGHVQRSLVRRTIQYQKPPMDRCTQ